MHKYILEFSQFGKPINNNKNSYHVFCVDFKFKFYFLITFRNNLMKNKILAR